ncbi:hypothetical protein [Synechococcus sp. ROS8604]|uniref:hypothetical protein n=1 Tax=Synechococcus sp. ROS8604 TaxID=1442557 RepID=UPI001646366E|nr:hypothetical protein [Synechococcus sp. ROS8604]
MYLIERRNQNDQGVISQISSEKIMAIHLHNQSFRPNFVKGLGQEGANFMTSSKILKQSPISILGVPGDIQIMQKWLKNQNLLV